MVSSFIRGYSVSSTVGSSFDVATVDGEVGVVHSTTHLNQHKYDFWIYGDDFVSYQSSDYTAMRYSKKYKYSPSSYQRRGVKLELLVVVDVVFVLGPPIYPPVKLIMAQIVIVGGFWMYQCHCTALLLVSSWRRDYLAEATDGSSFDVVDGGVTGDVVPSIYHLSPQKSSSYLSR